MLERDYDVKRLNKVINAPEVVKWIAHDSLPLPIDASHIVEDLNNYVLMSDLGGFVYIGLGDGESFEVHSQVLEAGRGENALSMAWESLRYMFTKTQARTIFTRVPVNNTAAAALTKACGFRRDFRLKEAWKAKGAVESQDVEFYRLSVLDWALHAPDLDEMGKWFHHRLVAQGVEQNHRDDITHDRVVGAALSMLFTGEVEKGVREYNLWARQAGYTPIALAARSPCLISIGSAILEFDLINEDFRVVAKSEPYQMPQAVEPPPVAPPVIEIDDKTHELVAPAEGA